jgi:hypothetical protein
LQILINLYISKQEFIAALNDPDATALWFIGHGVYDTKTGIFGIEKLGDPLEEIELADGSTITSAEIAALNLDLSRFKQITFHACGQDLQSWRNLFPNAEFCSWKCTTRAWQYYWWQWGATYNMAVAALPPVIDDALGQTGQYATINAGYVNNLAPVANYTEEFTLHSDLQAVLNGKSFNFITSENNINHVLFSCTINSGITQLSSQSVNYNYSADFDIIINDETLNSLLVNPLLWHVMNNVNSGVTVINNSNGSISDEEIFKGIGVLIWGQSANTVPTLSEWGLIIFGSLLLITGVIFVWRRQA